MKGLHPGATWRRSDLQCHTPRDHSWKGNTELPGTTEADEAARQAWADSIIAACHDKGVSVIAITDHHDICLANYVQESADRDGGKVLVFPGFEVTCKDNAQCLIIIDPNTSLELRDKFISLLKGIIPSSKKLGRTPQTTPTDLTVEELFENIHLEDDLRENCVILPHFSDGNAHKHINVQGHHLRFAQLPCDGVYIEKPY